MCSRSPPARRASSASAQTRRRSSTIGRSAARICCRAGSSPWHRSPDVGRVMVTGDYQHLQVFVLRQLADDLAGRLNEALDAHQRPHPDQLPGRAPGERVRVLPRAVRLLGDTRRRAFEPTVEVRRALPEALLHPDLDRGESAPEGGQRHDHDIRPGLFNQLQRVFRRPRPVNRPAPVVDDHGLSAAVAQPLLDERRPRPFPAVNSVPTVSLWPRTEIRMHECYVPCPVRGTIRLAARRALTSRAAPARARRRPAGAPPPSCESHRRGSSARGRRLR